MFGLRMRYLPGDHSNFGDGVASVLVPFILDASFNKSWLEGKKSTSRVALRVRVTHFTLILGLSFKSVYPFALEKQMVLSTLSSEAELELLYH